MKVSRDDLVRGGVNTTSLRTLEGSKWADVHVQWQRLTIWRIFFLLFSKSMQSSSVVFKISNYSLPGCDRD